MQKTLKMTVDVNKKAYYSHEVNQNDSLKLDIKVVENGVAKDLTLETIQLNYLNANNTIASIAGGLITTTGNNIIINCPVDCTRSAGVANFQVVISKDGLQTSTFAVDIQVKQGVINSQLPSENIATIVEELVETNNIALATKAQLEIDIANGNTAVMRSDLNTAMSELENMSTLVESISINPDKYLGPVYNTDFKKLQKAYNDAITNKTGILLNRPFEITGQGTIMLSLKYNTPRFYVRTTSVNNGKIIKNDDGFWFSSEFADTSDFIFSDLTFETTTGAITKVFDLTKLIGVNTYRCNFVGLNTIFYADDTRYMQSCSMNGDLLQGLTGHAIDVKGGFDISIYNVLMESGNAGFINQRTGVAPYDYFTGFSVSNCTVESIMDATKPAFKLRSCRGVKIKDNHFESNRGGVIAFDSGSSLLSVNIEGNTCVEAFKQQIIKWGGICINCYSANNINISNFGMHDTSAVTEGTILSVNDYYNSAYPNNDINKRLRILNVPSNEAVYTALTGTDNYKSTLTGGEIKRISITVAGTNFTANQTKSVAFVFPEAIRSDDIISIWSYDKTGLDFTIKNWYTSEDKLTVYYLITNNTAISMTLAKLRVTVLKTMPTILG